MWICLLYVCGVLCSLEVTACTMSLILLNQMESTTKVYEVKLVLDVARFGDDPLGQNGSLHFQALNIPWYSTTSHGQIVSNFLKKVKMPYDQILEIVGVDTGPLEDLLHDGKMSNSSREQITWLEQTLALTSNNWKIVVGYDPLVDCNEVHTTKTTKIYEPLRHIFEKYAVNAYVSTGGSCGHFHHDNSMSYIQNPIPGDQTDLDGFFLHRVSPLEMETLLINLDGEVVQRSVVHQHGREAICKWIGASTSWSLAQNFRYNMQCEAFSLLAFEQLRQLILQLLRGAPCRHLNLRVVVEVPTVKCAQRVPSPEGVQGSWLPVKARHDGPPGNLQVSFDVTLHALLADEHPAGRQEHAEVGAHGAAQDGARVVQHEDMP
ncbi:unnamed protein product [Triticum turgidum subsp. durum]|uniref:Uncharacterized protein n=1 Tax=Triticum turgidum subsp. durum TaxID=4567 RepID=A0A9R1BJU5_TRITD|nr:unnamed protein product [Triticum turgidum subsp. durum]